MRYLMTTACMMVLAVLLTNGAVTLAREEGGLIPGRAPAPLQAKDFSGLLGMEGFSDAMLGNHFKLYEGYVRNTGILLGKLDRMIREGGDRSPEFAELKRRLGWEFNGMLLHEYYFENLGGTGVLEAGSTVYEKITESFGSVDHWKRDFVSAGSMRGIGWVVLYQEPVTGRLVNQWINEHEAGHLAGARPLLVMDVFEHAYMTDYQLDKAAYIEAFFKNIRWQTVADRLRDRPVFAEG